jgi:hypothetical protein
LAKDDSESGIEIMPTVKRRRKKRAIVAIGRARIEGALRGELLGAHPGQVSVRIMCEVYDAATQRSMKVPEWGVKLLVDGWETLEEARAACEAGLKAWIAGRVIDGVIECGSCGCEVPVRGRRKK